MRNNMADEQRYEHLIQLAVRGDTVAFEELIRLCHSKAYAVAFRYMKNEQDAMDVVQETYVRLFLKLKTFSYKSRFETWLIRIVINCCYDALRKQKKERCVGEDVSEVIDFIEEAGPLGEYEHPEQAVILAERQAVLQRAVDALVPDHRDVIILREYEQYSYEEIADILNVSQGTVKSRIHRAKQALRIILMEQNPDFFV